MTVRRACITGGAGFIGSNLADRLHAAGAEVSGSGITLTTALSRTHFSGSQVSDNLPTPGAPNRYQRQPH